MAGDTGRTGHGCVWMISGQKSRGPYCILPRIDRAFILTYSYTSRVNKVKILS